MSLLRHISPKPPLPLVKKGGVASARRSAQLWPPKFVGHHPGQLLDSVRHNDELVFVLIVIVAVFLRFVAGLVDNIVGRRSVVSQDSDILRRQEAAL